MWERNEHFIIWRTVLEPIVDAESRGIDLDESKKMEMWISRRPNSKFGGDENRARRWLKLLRIFPRTLDSVSQIFRWNAPSSSFFFVLTLWFFNSLKDTGQDGKVEGELKLNMSEMSRVRTQLGRRVCRTLKERVDDEQIKIFGAEDAIWYRASWESRLRKQTLANPTRSAADWASKTNDTTPAKVSGHHCTGSWKINCSN